jgi:hypothetical protein
MIIFSSGVHPAYFGDKEPIAPLGDCLDVAGSFGVVLQRLPQLANRHAEAAVKIDERISRPEAASKFVATNYFSGAFKECDEEPMG